MKHNFKGVISALLTPFDQGKVDYKSLENLVQYQLNNGIDGFVVNGTTAESPTLNWDEVEKIYQCVRTLSKDNVPIIVGTGSNSTEQTIEASKKASRLGADALLVVVPYYNKPPQRGIVQHFTAVAKSTSTPVILYNVPGRTVVSLAVEGVVQLTQVENIIGIKEASGDLSYDKNLLSKVPTNFVCLSGDDGTYLPFLKEGGHGIISVMSNVITKACADWTKLARDKNWSKAEADFKKYENFINGIYVEANPIVPKWMLYKMGLFKSPEMRLPLVDLDPALRTPTEKLLKEFSLI